MSIGDEDTGEAAVAFVSGVLVGFAATLLFVRVQRNRKIRANAHDDDYYYEGGDLFI
jgi:hypothetical protein